MNARNTEPDWKFGDPIEGAACPQCGVDIVYNGNYHCEWCDWVMPAEHAGMSKQEKHLYNVAYANLMMLQGKEPIIDHLILKRNGEPW